MTAQTTSSDDSGRGYGRSGYGAGGYGPAIDDNEPPSTDPKPTPDPPTSPMPDRDPIRLTADVAPEGDWPENMFRSDEDIREVIREMDLGGGSDIDPRRLDAVENRLDRLEELIHDLNTEEGVSEERVRELLEERTTDPSRIEGLESTLDDLSRAVERLESRPGGGGDVSVDLGDELAEIRRARRELEIVGGPRHTRTVADGPHEDDGYHPYGAWGLVVTAEEDVHWREAAVHAESEGTMQLDVYEMDYEPNETYDVGNRVMTRQIKLDGGRQTVYPDVFLHRGQTFFLTRDSQNPTGDDVVPLKRGAEGVDWGDLNDSEVPLTFECSWQLGRSGPGSQAFRDYQDAGWDSVMHHWRDLEFGYNEEA